MNLRKLALVACEEDAGLAVLGDAVLETGWADRRVGRLLDPTLSADAARDLHRRSAATPTREWARACAAVLMFGGWTKGWYAWGYRPPPPTSREMYAMVRRLWSPDAIRDQMNRTSPLLGLVRRA